MCNNKFCYKKEHVLTFFLMSENKEIKCVFLGDSGVGKSCILNVYINGSEGDNMPTIGAAYFSKKVNTDIICFNYNTKT